MSKGDGTKEDRPYKDKLRSASSHLPSEVARGLENLGNLVHSTPARGAIHAAAAANSSTPVPDETIYNRPKISDKIDVKRNLSFDTSAIETDTREDSTLVNVSLDRSDISVKFSTPVANMSQDAAMEALNEKIRRLEKLQGDHQNEVEHLKQVCDNNTKHFEGKLEKSKAINEEQYTEINSLTDQLNARDGRDWETPMGKLENQMGDVMQKLSEFQHSRDRLEDNASKKEDSLTYRKHTDAIRHLGRKPEVFEKPTITRNAVDFVDEYIVYARGIHADCEYWFDGIAQFLKGEAKNYFDSYRAVRHKSDHTIVTFREAFLTRFKRVSLDELKKGASQRKQGVDESVRDYGVEMQRLMGRMKVDEEFKLEFLITNMKPTLQEPVLAAYPTTVEEALIEAEKQEAVIRSLGKMRAMELESEVASKFKGDQAGLLEKLRMQEAELNAMHHDNQQRWNDRSRNNEKRSDKYNNGAGSQKPNYNNPSNGGNNSRAGSSSSKSPGRNLNASYSKERWDGKSGNNHRSKSSDGQRSKSRDSQKHSGDNNKNKSSGNNQNFKGNNDNGHFSGSNRNEHSGSNLETLPAPSKTREQVNY